MKQIYFFFFLLFAGIIKAQIVNIPDPFFKIMLTESACVWDESGVHLYDADTNDDGEIQLSEAQAVTGLYLVQSEITDLTGIEAFTNIIRLDCTYNQLTNINLSGLTQLEELGCSHNNLTSIQLPSPSVLRRFHCVDNDLTSIDVSFSTNLEYLECTVNSITTINLNGLIHLEEVALEFNEFTTIDLGMLPALKKARVGYNNLTSLNVVGTVNLEWLDCTQASLTTLNLTNLPNLQQLSCSRNNFTTLTISNLPALAFFDCSYGQSSQLTSLNLYNLPSLERLFCFWNTNLATLDLSGTPNLRELYCGYSGLTTLDVSNLANLTILDCTWTTQMRSLFIKNGALQHFYFVDSLQLGYICADESMIDSIQQTINNSNYLHYNQNCVVNSYCSFVPGGNYNTINGNITFDTDNNGCDTNDVQYPNLKITINDGTIEGAAFTNLQGVYTFNTSEGDFTLAPVFENPAWYTVSPPTATVSFLNSNNNSHVQNFCVTANGVHNDIELILAPVGIARPGFDSAYQLIYKNKGNQLLNGTINFNFDDATLDFESASQIVDSQTTGNLSFNFSNLKPFESRSIQLMLNVNSPTEIPAVNIGDVLHFSATISPVSGDETPEDNLFDLSQIVLGSFDPNDKICLEGNIVSPERIGTFLHYTINFENTGNASAENIVVKDVIDENKFDFSSLQLISASNTVNTKVTGSKIEFIFENINLGAGQHGNVCFKIRTKNDLSEGDAVSNKANIYFDYNFPVETNTAVTAFQILGIGQNHIDSSVLIYPNPASHTININANNAIKSIQLFDIQGRILTTRLETENYANLDISQYSNGIYFLKITTEYGMKTERFVKE